MKAETLSESIAMVEVVKVGFFHPPDPTQPDRVAAHGFHVVAVPGIPCSVMFCHARVLVDPGARDHLVITAHHPRLEDEVLRNVASAVASSYPDAALSLTFECSTGRARVRAVTAGSAFSVAAATAAWMCSGGWDESDPIVVDVDGHSVALSLSIEGGRWKASRKGDDLEDGS